MPSFSLTLRLSSYSIDKALISRLEEYLRARAASEVALGPEEFARAYQLIMVDDIGSETNTSIKDVLPAQFPDNMSRLRLNFDTIRLHQLGKTRVDVDISFGSDRLYSEIDVNVDGEN